MRWRLLCVLGMSCLLPLAPQSPWFAGLSFRPVGRYRASQNVFAHKEAHYFAVNSIGKDQVESYAARKGMKVSEVERWLSPVLGYDPRRVAGAS